MPSTVMTVMQTAARKAARNLRRDFGEVEHLQVSRKGPADFVSRADKKAEEVIVDSLRGDRPGYGLLLEEGGEIAGTDKTHRFIVDPLDGTTNFLHGIPHFATSIALERTTKTEDGETTEVVAGCIYQPLTDEMFFAERGRGAFVNDGTRGGGDRRLKPSRRDQFSTCIFATGIPFLGRPGHAKFLRELHQVMGASAGVRRMGAASLDLVWTAMGRYDGFWERGLAPWDIAAGLLICEEAGLRVESLSGGDVLEAGDPVVANGPLFSQLKSRLD